MKTNKFKVGDKVYCFGHGWGIITEIDIRDLRPEPFPISVEVHDRTIIFTRDGKRHEADSLPSMLTEKEAREIDRSIEKSKTTRKRRVRHRAWLNLYTNGSVLCFENLKDAEQNRKYTRDIVVETRKIEWETFE